jgi:uncharacterized protein (TIGR04141 family)
MVILLKLIAQDGIRFFAVSHGFGFHIINKERIESNFGLITTLNSIDPARIKSIDTRSLGVQTIQKREASNLFTDLGEFAFAFDSEILQIISGACNDRALGTKLSGSDNLNLSADLVFEELPEKCLAVYDRYKLDSYKAKFDFVDHIRHEKDPSILDILDQQLVDAINSRQDDLKISVVYPDQIDYEKSSVFRFSGRRRSRSHSNEVSDVTLSAVYKHLDSENIDLERLKDKIKVIGIDPTTDEPCTPSESLYSYFVFETIFRDKRYVLSNKKWYYIDQDYLIRLNRDLQQHVQQMTSPTLKLWPPTLKSEGEYNKLYSIESDYLWLDTDSSFSGAGYSYSKVEVADFYHFPSNKLFFVKKLNRSATLSHLFSQATISADLFRESLEYQDFFLKKLKCKWPTQQFDNTTIQSLTFVYTIGSSRSEDLVESLPVFSKINLLKHLKLLKKLNFPVELAKVEIR